MTTLASTAPRQGPQEWRQGWGLVLTGAVGIALGGMHFHLIGTMMKPLQAAFGWGRGEVAFGLTLIATISVAAQLVVGGLVDRLGARCVALWGAGAFGLAYMLLGLAGPAIKSWFVLCAVFAVLGQGVGVVVWTSGIVRHFRLQRGLALAAALAGTGIMVAITPTLVVWLQAHVGLRGVFFTIGGVGATLIWLLSWWLLEDGAPPHDQPESTVAAGSTLTPAMAGVDVAEALRSRHFWQLALALGLIACCVGTFIVHLQPLLIDSGMDAATAASIAFFVGPAMIGGRLLTGSLFDRVDTRVVSCGAFALPGLACLLLLQVDGSYTMAAVAGILAGLGTGAEVDVVAYVTSRYFGLRRYGALFSLLVGLYSFGIGMGSSVVGAMVDRQHTYQPTLIGLIGFSVLAVLLAATLGPPPFRADKSAGH